MEPFCYKLVAGIIPQHHSIFTSSLEAFSPSVSHAEFLSAILVGPSPFCISG
jgi:hypothetical protein